MNRWMRWAVRLYPARWRVRYEREFGALLEDVQPGWREFFDVLRGAILMQIRMPNVGKLAVAAGLAGVAVAGVIAFRMPDQFISTAVMRVSSGDRDSTLDRLNATQQVVLSRSSLEEIILQQNIYQTERRKLPLEDIVGQMRSHDVRMEIVDGNGPGTTFTVSFQYPDRYQAQRVTQELTARVIEAQLHPGLVGKQTGTTSVVDAASLPQSAVAPNRLTIVALGLVSGLVLAVVLLGVRRWPLVVACGAAAAAIACAGSFVIPSRYVSSAVLLAPDQQSARQMAQAVVDRGYLQSVVQEFNLYPQERRRETVDAVIERMRDESIRVQALDAHSPSGRQGVIISFTAEGSGFTAQRVTRALADHAVTASADHRVRLLEQASLPEVPSGKHRLTWTSLGLLAGLLAGSTWTAFHHGRAAAAQA